MKLRDSFLLESGDAGAAYLLGCSASPLYSVLQHCWVLPAKAFCHQQGQRFGVESTIPVLWATLWVWEQLESAIQTVEKGGAWQISAYADQIICLFKMFISPFPWWYFLNCHMHFLWYFSLVKLRRESLIISLGYIPNKVMFVIFTV